MDTRLTDETNDAERYPTLTPEGARVLRFMREHPAAPIYRNESGNRLLQEEVDRLKRFEGEVFDAQVGWTEGTVPNWVDAFVEEARYSVPHYRTYSTSTLAELPTIGRADLSKDIARFVPDALSLDRVINFRTSGTTGHPLLLPSHPVIAASYLAFHKRALQRFGITLKHGRGKVGVVLAGFQEKCFTYTSVTPVLNESGLAKINLHPNDWRDPADRARYLDALDPEVYSGDPISFLELMRLPLTSRPCALISTSMALSSGLRRELEQRFQCPVVDVYSMNEAGPLAVYDERRGGHVLLQHRMFVEIVDAEGRGLPFGERGEITLTGGFNFYLPLIRYRTGDYASLERRAGELVLVDLLGRPPIRFRTATGQWKNNIEVTHALQRYALPQYTLRQRSDGSFLFTTLRDAASREQIEKSLAKLFGEDAVIRFADVECFTDKVIQYTSELPQE